MPAAGARRPGTVQQPLLWRLDDDERRVLTVLGQRYLPPDLELLGDT